MGSPIGALKTLELSSNSMLTTLDRLGNLLVLLEDVNIYQDNSCESISLPDYPFKGYDQKCISSKHFYHWMRRSKFRVKTIATPDTEADRAIRCTRT